MFKTSKSMAARNVGSSLPRVVNNVLVGTMTPLKLFYSIDSVDFDATPFQTITNAINQAVTPDSGTSLVAVDSVKFAADILGDTVSSELMGIIPITSSVLVVLNGEVNANDLLYIKTAGDVGSIIGRAKGTTTALSNLTDDASATYAFPTHAAVGAGADFTLIAPFDVAVASPTALTYNDTIASKKETSTMIADLTNRTAIDNMDADLTLRGQFNSASIFVFDGSLPADYIAQSLWMGKQHSLGNYVFPKHWASL